MDVVNSMTNLREMYDGRRETAHQVSLANALLGMRGQASQVNLGRIIVSDLFIGNTDRFDFHENRGAKESWPKIFKNAGNVIFVPDNGVLVLCGMDPLDPTQLFKFNNAQTLRSPRNTNYGWNAWLGELLLESEPQKGKLEELGKEALAGILTVLTWGQQNMGLGSRSIEGSRDDVYWVSEGMRRAKDDLKSMCQQILKTDNAPTALKDVMVRLNWCNSAQRVLGDRLRNTQPNQPLQGIGSHRQPVPPKQ